VPGHPPHQELVDDREPAERGVLEQRPNPVAEGVPPDAVAPPDGDDPPVRQGVPDGLAVLHADHVAQVLGLEGDPLAVPVPLVEAAVLDQVDEDTGCVALATERRRKKIDGPEVVRIPNISHVKLD
jgi:hypothetical protein